MKLTGKTFGIALAIAAIVFAVSRSTSPRPVAQPGQFTVDTDTKNLGDMSVNEIKTADFILTNTSGTPLVLSRFETSCDCTFAQVTAASGTSPWFNMRAHMPQSDYFWQTTVEPGARATIEVKYEPAIMPVSGLISRSVLFKTSDPAKPDMELTVIAKVHL